MRILAATVFSIPLRFYMALKTYTPAGVFPYSNSFCLSIESRSTDPVLLKVFLFSSDAILQLPVQKYLTLIEDHGNTYIWVW